VSAGMGARSNRGENGPLPKDSRVFAKAQSLVHPDDRGSRTSAVYALHAPHRVVILVYRFDCQRSSDGLG
jgi:hypothetical protein